MNERIEWHTWSLDNRTVVKETHWVTSPQYLLQLAASSSLRGLASFPSVTLEVSFLLPLWSPLPLPNLKWLAFSHSGLFLLMNLSTPPYVHVPSLCWIPNLSLHSDGHSRSPLHTGHLHCRSKLSTCKIELTAHPVPKESNSRNDKTLAPLPRFSLSGWARCSSKCPSKTPQVSFLPPPHLPFSRSLSFLPFNINFTLLTFLHHHFCYHVSDHCHLPPRILP